MTRQEYRTKAKELFPWSENVKNFPQLLDMMAVNLFVIGDCNSELANETRGRLIQINQSGVIDP